MANAGKQNQNEVFSGKSGGFQSKENVSTLSEQAQKVKPYLDIILAQERAKMVETQDEEGNTTTVSIIELANEVIGQKLSADDPKTISLMLALGELKNDLLAYAKDAKVDSVGTAVINNYFKRVTAQVAGL